MIDDRLKQFYRFYKIKDLIDIRDKYYGFMKEAERSFDSFKDHEFCKDGLTEFYPDLSYEDYAEMVVFMADYLQEVRKDALYTVRIKHWLHISDLL